MTDKTEVPAPLSTARVEELIAIGAKRRGNGWPTGDPILNDLLACAGELLSLRDENEKLKQQVADFREVVLLVPDDSIPHGKVIEIATAMERDSTKHFSLFADAVGHGELAMGDYEKVDMMLTAERYEALIKAESELAALRAAREEAERLTKEATCSRCNDTERIDSPSAEDGWETCGTCYDWSPEKKLLREVRRAFLTKERT